MPVNLSKFKILTTMKTFPILFLAFSTFLVPLAAQEQQTMVPGSGNSLSKTEMGENERATLRHGEFGIRYMPTFSNLELQRSSGELVDGQFTMTHGWGVMLGFNFTRNIGLQAEVNYNRSSQEFMDRTSNRKVNLSYLNIPLMLSLNTNKSAPLNFNFVAGPQYALNVDSNIEGGLANGNGSVDTVRAVVKVKTGDVGLAYGAGLEVMLNKNRTIRFDIGFRGYYGWVDIKTDSSDDPNTFNVVVQRSRKTYSGYAGISFLF
jgi:hypothetical protein